MRAPIVAALLALSPVVNAAFAQIADFRCPTVGNEYTYLKVITEKGMERSRAETRLIAKRSEAKSCLFDVDEKQGGANMKGVIQAPWGFLSGSGLEKLEEGIFGGAWPAKVGKKIEGRQSIDLPDPKGKELPSTLELTVVGEVQSYLKMKGLYGTYDVFRIELREVLKFINFSRPPQAGLCQTVRIVTEKLWECTVVMKFWYAPELAMMLKFEIASDNHKIVNELIFVQ